MSQVATVNAPEEWTAVKSLVGESWDFAEGKTYQIENTGYNECYLVESATEPDNTKRSIGILLKGCEKIVHYVPTLHTLWVRGIGKEAYLNITIIGE